jgi:hypothetical protein
VNFVDVVTPTEPRDGPLVARSEEDDDRQSPDRGRTIMKHHDRLETTMSHTSAFNTPEGEARFLAAYDAEMMGWPVPYEEINTLSRFGTTHVVVCGPKSAPPLVLLHGYMATLTMWLPNISAFSKDYRVYAVDVMGQPSKSTPYQPISNTQDFVSWLTATLECACARVPQEHTNRWSRRDCALGGVVLPASKGGHHARTAHDSKARDLPLGVPTCWPNPMSDRDDDFKPFWTCERFDTGVTAADCAHCPHWSPEPARRTVKTRPC